MKLLFKLLVPSFALLTTALEAQTLYSIDGKEVQVDQLSPAARQTLHDIDMQRHQQVQALIDAQILDNYVAERAAKTKKSKEEVELEELRVNKEPSDKEIKAFYEENKARIPPNYTYEQLKPELKRFVQEKKSVELRQALLAKLKKSQNFKLLLTEPTVPTVKIETAGFPTKGKKEAKVKVVEFADYQCPHCKEASVAFSQLMKKYSDKVELTYIDFPVNPSGISRVVSEGAYCAGKQNKFWEFHELAFREQSSLSKDSPVQFAKKLKLNDKDFATCLGSAEAKAFVSKGKDEGDRIGVTGTPAIYINGKRYSGDHTHDGIKKAVDKAL